MADNFEVTGVRGVAEPEPGVVEITLELRGQSPGVLRMNLLTFLNLWASIKYLASPAETLTDDDDDAEASSDASAA